MSHSNAGRMTVGKPVLSCLLIALLFFGREVILLGEAGEDGRVVQVQEQLDLAKSILNQTTNENEKVLWQDRISLTERELENTRRFVQLEQQEKQFGEKRKQSPEYVLREALSTVETGTSDAEREARSLRTRIRNLKSSRVELDRQNSKRGDTGEDEKASKERAKREARIQNLDAEILVCVYQRDAAELTVRVARDAERIEALLTTNALNARATVQLILLKRRAISDSRKTGGEYASLAESLDARREQTAETRRFSEQKFRHLDEEISSLKEGYRNATRARVSSDNRENNVAFQQYLRRSLDVAESEKDQMEDRLKYLGAQVDALDKSVAVASQGGALLRAETTFLVHDLAVAKRRYMQRILVPIAVIAILCVLYSLLSFRVFPAFYHQDSLFLARRMGRYSLFMMIAVVLIIFFMEDLRAIATVIGIVGAAIVIALQDLCSSFAGWFVIVASRKIKVGDRVEIDGHRGDVIDLQLLRTTLVEVNSWLGVDEPTGRVVVIPNSFIFKSHVFNYAHMHRSIWDKIDITVTYETPVKEAADLLMKVLTEETGEEFAEAARGEEQMEKTYGLRHAINGPRIDTIIADSGVCFRLYYATHYQRACATRNRLMTRILDEFEKNQALQFAYPTRRQIQSVVPMPAPAGSGNR